MFPKPLLLFSSARFQAQPAAQITSISPLIALLHLPSVLSKIRSCVPDASSLCTYDIFPSYQKYSRITTNTPSVQSMALCLTGYFCSHCNRAAHNF